MPHPVTTIRFRLSRAIVKSSSFGSIFSGPPERRLATLSLVHHGQTAACGSAGFCVSGRILNQMAYMAGRNTSVIMVPPNVPPISV